MRPVSFLFRLAFFCATWVSVVHSFDFQVGTPTQCDDLTVSWSGGNPPFTLTVVIPGGDNLNFNIPSNAFQNNQGTFKTQLPVAKSTQVLFAMSDASGQLTGGTSKLLVVGDTLTGATCNTTLPSNDFFFTVDSSPTECGFYHYTLYDGAILPISIFFYVPGGHESFVISPISTSSFTWNTNLTAQTSFISTMVDSQNRRGGSDQLKTVSPSNDQSCIIASNPSSTTGSSSQTSTSTSTTSPTSTSSSLATGAIIGIAVGAVAILGLVTVLVAFCLIKRRRSRRQNHPDVDLLAGEPAGLYVQRSSPSDLSGSPASSQPMLSQQYAPNPFPITPMNQAQQYQQRPYPVKLMNPPRQEYQPEYEPDYYPRPTSNVMSYPPSASSASGQGSARTAVSSVNSKGASPAGTATSSRRLIVHRDVEDDLEELPPQYSDRRAPIESIPMQEPGVGSGSSGGSGAPTSSAPIRSMSMRKG